MQIMPFRFQDHERIYFPQIWANIKVREEPPLQRKFVVKVMNDVVIDCELEIRLVAATTIAESVSASSVVPKFVDLGGR